MKKILQKISEENEKYDSESDDNGSSDEES